MAQASEIRYLTPLSVDVKKKKYCRFKRSGIKYIDYKDPEFLKSSSTNRARFFPVASPELLSSSSVVSLRPLSVPVTSHSSPTLPT